MSAALTRFEQLEMALRHRKFAEHPEQQAEAIAIHYLSHVSHARDLLELVKCRRQGLSGPNLDRCIEHLVGDLKQAHRRDLGVELEWPAAAKPAGFPNFEICQTAPTCLTWRPIDTAPRDGTEILVLFNSATVPIVRLCWWDDGAAREWDALPAKRPGDVGWWSYKHSVTQEMIEGMNPIGWMPMPPRPA